MQPVNATLRPVDIPVLLYLAEHPGAPYAQVAAVLGVSTNTAHAARARLITSGLAHGVARAGTEVARGPLQVWPSHLGSVVGVGIHPLLADAPSIASRDPSLYRWLALVDVLRGGDARARTFARRVLPKLVAALP